MGRPELQRAVGRLLDGSFQPRVTKRRNPKQLELFSPSCPGAIKHGTGVDEDG